MAGIYTSLQDALYAITTKALIDYPNSSVIFSHEDGSEPTGSYVSIGILSVEQQGRHTSSGLTDVENLDTEYELTTTTANEVYCQFSFVGSDSGDMASSFNQRINNSPLVLEEASRNKLGVMRKSQVRRSPQKRETKWVEYHNLDVTFSYHVVTTEVVDIIEAVVVQQNDETPFVIPENFVITP